MLLHTGGEMFESPHGAPWKMPDPSPGCKHRYPKQFHLSPGRQDCSACPANSPTRYLCTSPGPGQLLHSRSRSQQRTRGRKDSQKQLVKALTQPPPCLYLLRGLDLVQILEKKSRKCFTCYLVWSCCSEQLLVPREPWGSGQVSHKGSAGVCGARQSTAPAPQGFHTAWPLPSAKYSNFCCFTCAQSRTGQADRIGEYQ